MQILWTFSNILVHPFFKFNGFVRHDFLQANHDAVLTTDFRLKEGPARTHTGSYRGVKATRIDYFVREYYYLIKPHLSKLDYYANQGLAENSVVCINQEITITYIGIHKKFVMETEFCKVELSTKYYDNGYYKDHL